MSDVFSVFDAKENLFLTFDNNKIDWVWITFDSLNKVNNHLGMSICYSFIPEGKIEYFCNGINNLVKDGSWGNFDYSKAHIRTIIGAMPNVWLIRMIGSGSSYRVDFTDGIKV